MGKFSAIDFILITLVLFIHFLPTIIAVYKKHLQLNAILMLNILLGWTFIGWVFAFVWAMTKTKGEK